MSDLSEIRAVLAAARAAETARAAAFAARYGSRMIDAITRYDQALYELQIAEIAEIASTQSGTLFASDAYYCARRAVLDADLALCHREHKRRTKND